MKLEDLLNPAPRHMGQVVLVGILAVAIMAAYGLDYVLWGVATDKAEGAGAVGFGIMWIAVACFLHLHFFWSWRERFVDYAQIGKLLSLIVAVGGLSYYAWRELLTQW